jgi:hypothetical protein
MRAAQRSGTGPEHAAAAARGPTNVDTLLGLRHTSTFVRLSSFLTRL